MSESQEPGKLEWEAYFKFVELWDALSPDQRTEGTFEKLCSQIHREYAPDPLLGFDERARDYVWADLSFKSGPSPGEELQESPKKYRLKEPIEKGGEGSVWEAYDETTPSKVAIKFLHRAPRNEAEWGEFRAKTAQLSLRRHSNTVAVQSSGQYTDGRPYIVMEFMPDAQPIDVYCRMKRAPLKRRIELIITLCDAVAFINRGGCVHRDLKPKNVLVSDGQGLKVIDLGLAHLRGTLIGAGERGSVIGTLDYMAPEQMEMQEEPTDRADVYAIGVILHELLTGTVPLKLTDSVARSTKGGLQITEEAKVLLRKTIPKAASEQLKLNASFLAELASFELDSKSRPGIPPGQRDLVRAQKKLLNDYLMDLDWIVRKCLHKSDRPGFRYETAEMLAEDLRRFLQNEPIAARPFSLSYTFIRKCRREPGKMAISAIAVIGLLASIMMAFLSFKWQRAQFVADTNERLASENAEKTALAEERAEKENDLRKKTAAVTTLLEGVAVKSEGRWQEELQKIAEAWNAYPENDRRRDGMLRYLMNEASQSGVLLNPIPIVTRGPINDDSSGRAVSFNKDGSRLLIESHGSDGGVELWSTATSRRIAKISDFPRSDKFRFTPDGGTIVGFEESVGATLITEYDAITGQKETSQQSSFEVAKHVTFSADGKSHFVLVKRVNRFEVLDRINGRSLGSRELKSGFPRFEVSDSGSFAVTVSPDGGCVLWNLTASTVTDLTDVKHSIGSVRFSPDSKRLVMIRTEVQLDSEGADKSAQGRGSEATLWDTENGQLIAAWSHSNDAEQPGSKAAVLDCGFNADGTEVRSYGIDMHLQRRSAANGEPLASISLSRYVRNMQGKPQLAYEPNSAHARLTDSTSTEILVDTSVSPPRIGSSSLQYDRVISSSEDDRIVHVSQGGKWAVCETQAGKEISRIPWGYVLRGTFSPDGGLFARNYKGGADIWKVAQGDYATDQADEMRLHSVWDKNEGSLSDSGIAFSPCATLMAFWSGNVLRIADLAPRPVFQQWPQTHRIPLENHQVLEFSASERRRIDLRSMKTLQSTAQDPVLEYQLRHDGRILATDDDGRVFLLSTDTLEVIAETGNMILHSDFLPEFSPNGELVHALISHEDLPDCIGLWSSRTGKLLRELKPEPTADEEFSGWDQIQFAGNGQTILAMDHAGRFWLWKTSNGKLLASGPASESDTEKAFHLSADSEWLLQAEETDDETLITRYSVLTGSSDPPVAITGEQAGELKQVDASRWLLTRDSRHLVTLIKREQEEEEPTEYSFHFRVTDLQIGKHQDSEIFQSADAPEFRDGAVAPSGDLFAVVTTTGVGQKLWTVRIPSLAINSRDLDEGTWLQDGDFYAHFSDNGAAVLTENGFGQFAWDVETLQPVNADDVPIVSDGAFPDRFPLNLRPWGEDPFVTVDDQGKLIDLGNGLPVDWHTSLAPANAVMNIPVGLWDSGGLGGFGGRSVRYSLGPNWAFPLPAENQLHKPFVKLISTIPEIPNVIGFLQMNKHQVAEMEQRDSAWQEILSDPAGQKWISDLESAFLERSWYRSHALSNERMLNFDWPAAAFHLTKAIEKNPSDRDSIGLLMEANCITGRLDEARRTLQELRGKYSAERIVEIEAYISLAAGDLPGCQAIIDNHPGVKSLAELSRCLKGEPEAVATRLEALRNPEDSSCVPDKFLGLDRVQALIVCALAIHDLDRTEEARTVIKAAQEKLQTEIDFRTLPYARGIEDWQRQIRVEHLMRIAEIRLGVP